MSRKSFISLLLASLTFVGLGFLLFSSTGRDDVFKTFWSAYSLSEFGSILNYNGEAIEQSSSLLQVLMLGGLRTLFGGDVVVWGYLMGIFAGAGSIWMLFLTGRELKLDQQRLKALPWLGAACGFLIYWSFSGMETSLQTFCLLGLVWGSLRFLQQGQWWPFLLFLPLFLLCRPENPFLVVASFGIAWGILAQQGKSTEGNRRPSHSQAGIQKRRIGWLIALTLLASALIFIVRFLAFDHWFPLPVYAKAGAWGWERLYGGLRYLFIQLKGHPDLILYVLAASAGLWTIIRRWKSKPYRLLIAIFISVGIGAVVFSGGDWMENGRFLVPWMLLGMLLLPESRTWRTWLVPVLIAIQLMGVVWTARHHSTGRPLWTALPPTDEGVHGVSANVGYDPGDYPWFIRSNRIHSRDLAVVKAIDDLVSADYSKNRIAPRVLSQQAGMVAYYTAKNNYKEFHFIDLVGLTTKDFHDCPLTADRGHGFGGLNMDLPYLIADQKELYRGCGFEMPRFIFDLDNERDERKKALSGYRVLYQEAGSVETGDVFLPGMEVSRYQFVAVREE